MNESDNVNEKNIELANLTFDVSSVNKQTQN